MSMVKWTFTLLLLLLVNRGYSQTAEKIAISSITPTVSTGVDFTPWYNEDTSDLIAKVWTSANMQYIDVKLALQKEAKITKLCLYDYEGIFNTTPAIIYAVKGTQWTVLDTFTGPQYKAWDTATIGQVLADTIVVHRYGNDIPQKVVVYGIPTADTPVPGKIPMDGKRWYQLNNVRDDLADLFDGNLSNNVQQAYGKVLGNYDAYYPVYDGEVIDIDSIKLYDGAGMDTIHFKLYAIDSNWQKTQIAEFTGSQYNSWVGPNPSASGFQLSTPVRNARYLVINTSGLYPAEMELWGSYVAPPSIPAVPAKNIKLKYGFGVNAFEWDFEDPNSAMQIDSNRMKVAKTFSGIRHYLDWKRLEPNKGGYTFNPSHSGNWNYDTLYQACKAEGMEVLACIKTVPDWILNTYPSGDRDAENVPIDSVSLPFDSPSSYRRQAKVAFQFAARYGSNASVSTSLLSVDNSSRWTNDPPNTVKKGLDLIKYIECDNERDKWWKGRKAYQTGREYAANMSAFYDGHKNTMGAGVGVKNADPNMKVVIGGVANTSVDFLMGMIDWCKENRGYNTDGSVNLCWDVINYHIYHNDAGTSQGGNPTRGAAPEVCGSDSVAINFINVAHRYCNDMPVWITETGYDENSGSPLHAIAIGTKTVAATKADWILRTSLQYARLGIERVFLYQMYDDNPGSGNRFATSGLLNASPRSRRPAADFILQATKLMGDYEYKQTLSTNPIVDRYELNGSSIYVLVSPTENGSSASYTLSITGATTAKVYTPTAGQDTMAVSNSTFNSGNLTLTVTETPIFVKAFGSSNNQLKNAPAGEIMASTMKSRWEQSIQVYPNPATSYIDLQMQSTTGDDARVNIYSSTGVMVKSVNITNAAGTVSKRVDMSSLQPGLYIIELEQGANRAIKKIIKAVPAR